MSNEVDIPLTLAKDDGQTDKQPIEYEYGPGDLRVKAEFLIQTIADDATNINYKKEKVKGGQNKHRPYSKSIDPNKLCSRISQGKPCPYNEKCHFNHDTQLYFSVKPRDLGSWCIQDVLHGGCPYGLTCRMFSSHGQFAQYAKSQYGCGSAENRHGLSITIDRPIEKFSSIALCLPSFWKEHSPFLTLSPTAVPTESSIITPPIPIKASVVDETEKNEVSVEGEDADANGYRYTCCHRVHLPKDLQKSLRKKTITFPQSGIYLKEKGIVPRHEKQHSQKHKKARMDDTDPLPPAVTANEDSASSVDVSTTTLPSQEDSHISSPSSKTYHDVDPVSYEPRSLAKKSMFDAKNKLFLAPLTTLGHLPFRRLCVDFGADVTVSPMVLATHLLQGQRSEWALLKKHRSEQCYGIQIAGAHVDSVVQCTEMISDYFADEIQFIDLNVGCPLDFLFNSGACSALLQPSKKVKLFDMVEGMARVSRVPITVKMRTGISDLTSHQLMAGLKKTGAVALTVHGRTREQRYTKDANWSHIAQCVSSLGDDSIPLIGNGDIYSYTDYEQLKQTYPEISSHMLARGALIKPWLFTEIKEQRHWDITAQERLDIYRQFCQYGMEVWGSDTQGVNTTRRFLLEWMAFTHRYVPLGIIEDGWTPKMNLRPPRFRGRNELETLLASPAVKDWLSISDLFLGKTPDDFVFVPKHRSNAYG